MGFSPRGGATRSEEPLTVVHCVGRTARIWSISLGNAPGGTIAMLVLKESKPVVGRDPSGALAMSQRASYHGQKAGLQGALIRATVMKKTMTRGGTQRRSIRTGVARTMLGAPARAMECFGAMEMQGMQRRVCAVKIKRHSVPRLEPSAMPLSMPADQYILCPIVHTALRSLEGYGEALTCRTVRGTRTSGGGSE